MAYSREMISQYFHMTIRQAAKELNVSLTAFKRNSRDVGIQRWPYRKLKSINSIINDFQSLSPTNNSDYEEMNDAYGSDCDKQE
ncbi:Plant regulator RWP-RK [Artemisia annua]|uniref:Plant regulator RWP-RK n=1 Tax=Artemisia annua TaxID=35608 RepID=A0A2U1MKI6_ARTAN|nr:Plant regulator RWP-RK [Artemisia annua]